MFYDLLRNRGTFLIFSLLSPVFGIIAAEMVRTITSDLVHGSSILPILSGIIVFLRFAYRTVRGSRQNKDPESPWPVVARELIVLLGVFPATVLIGKIIFANIPPWEPVIGCVLIPAIALWLLAGIDSPSKKSHDVPEFRRGAKMLSQQEAIDKVASLNANSPNNLPPKRSK